MPSAFADFQPHVAHLAVERRAADAEAAGDFRHVALVLVDGEADHFRLDVLELAHVARFVGDRDAVREVRAGEVGQRVRLRLRLLRDVSRDRRRGGDAHHAVMHRRGGR